MADFKYKGFTYELILRPWKTGKSKIETIKWKTGYRNLWERISYDEFEKVKSEKESKSKIKTPIGKQ